MSDDTEKRSLTEVTEGTEGRGTASSLSSVSSVRGVFFGAYGVRAGWRIALWAGAVVCLVIVFGSAMTAAGVRPSFAAQVSIELAAALFAGWLLLGWIDRRPLGALGFAMDPAAPRDAAAGLLLGAAAIGVAAGVLVVAGSARWVADTGTVPEYVATLARAFVFFAVAAAAEEALFRGYAFQALVQGIGAWPAILVSSALFAYAHGGNDHVDAIALANIFLAGIMLAVAYLKTRSLWFATALHLAWNWVMSALLDFPVSGLQLNTPLYSARETGADWWTGGAFGPEAGVAATLVIAAGTVWMLRTRRLSESARLRELRPLVDTRLEGEWNAR